LLALQVMQLPTQSAAVQQAIESMHFPLQLILPDGHPPESGAALSDTTGTSSAASRFASVGASRRALSAGASGSALSV
jgi:hypothetical protein